MAIETLYLKNTEEGTKYNRKHADKRRNTSLGYYY